MLTATLLALGAAVLHAGWNLAAKRSSDRFGALWGQFIVAGVIAAVAVTIVGLPPARSLGFAALSGLIHVPYVVYLARAYDRSDFSVVYPVARGGGVVLAALGGALVLGDHLHGWAWPALGVIAVGLVSLAGRVRIAAVTDALVVALTIGAYSVSDAKGVRVAGTDRYVLVEFILLGVAVSVHGLATRRVPALRTAVMAQPWTVLASGLATLVTYGLVVAAFRYAPVGYVSGLRESSVVLAAIIGWRYESAGRWRLGAAGVVAAGVALLVVGQTVRP